MANDINWNIDLKIPCPHGKGQGCIECFNEQYMIHPKPEDKKEEGTVYTHPFLNTNKENDNGHY